jgi:hypothetical protein
VSAGFAWGLQYRVQRFRVQRFRVQQFKVSGLYLLVSGSHRGLPDAPVFICHLTSVFCYLTPEPGNNVNANVNINVYILHVKMKNSTRGVSGSLKGSG